MPSICRSFQDLLVVQISHKLHNCVLCHMTLLGRKGLSFELIGRLQPQLNLLCIEQLVQLMKTLKGDIF